MFCPDFKLENGAKYKWNFAIFTVRSKILVWLRNLVIFEDFQKEISAKNHAILSQFSTEIAFKIDSDEKNEFVTLFLFSSS